MPQNNSLYEALFADIVADAKPTSKHYGNLLKEYSKTQYEPLIPETKKGNKSYQYKFNSMTHFLGWSEELAKMDRVHPDKSSSDNDESQFSLSKSLNDAFDIIRKTKFDPAGLDRLSSFINKLKVRSYFHEEGYELEISEYIAGSRNHWLTNRTNNKPSRIIDDVLFIGADYQAGSDPMNMMKLGLELIASIYTKGVIPRKLVIVYTCTGWNNDTTKNLNMFIDVNFNDLNGIAKALHPSTFRRLTFRIEESYKNMSWGYGGCITDYTSKGYFSFIREGDHLGDEKHLDEQVDVLLGIEKKEQ